MKREVAQLEGVEFDVVVVGAGIYGACIARDAALRGLKVALIDKSDFGSATSHNSLKLIHGGIRYFQHFDFRRVRQSVLERRFWLAKAPHLVSPIEFVIPTFGHLTRGPVAFAVANVLHRMLGMDWNRGVADRNRIAMGEILSRDEFAERVPGIPLDRVSGAATWSDGQMSNADRVVLECVESAVLNGTVAANYVRAVEILHKDEQIIGIRAVDGLSDREVTVRCRFVVNACGPWAGAFLDESLEVAHASQSIPSFSRNMNVVVPRIDVNEAFGVSSTRTGDGLVGDQSRLFFVTPWKNVTIIGTTHFPFDGHPDDYAVSDAEIDEFIAEVNSAFPTANLKSKDVLYVYGGMTPTEEGDEDGEVVRSRHSDFVDHEEIDNLAGLLSVVGVKYTTARLVAEQSVDFVCKKLGAQKDGRLARETMLPGADARLATGSVEECDVDDEARALLSQYGRRTATVTGQLDSANRLTLVDAFRLCVRHAVLREMAVHLTDAIFRRTDLAAQGLMTIALLDVAVREMQELLGWSEKEAESERAVVIEKIRYLSK